MSFIFSRTRIIEMVYLFFGFLSVAMLYVGIFKYPNHERIVIEIALAVLLITFLAAADLGKNLPLWVAIPFAFALHFVVALTIADCIGLMPFQWLTAPALVVCFLMTTKISRYAKKHDLKII